MLLKIMTVALRPSSHSPPWLLSHTKSVVSPPLSKQRSLSTTTSSSFLFPRWKVPVVTATGDYRNEEWLEQDIGGPLYEHQTSLPKLPVNDIATTLQRFLPTAVPLAQTSNEIKHLTRAVEVFPQQAAVLQQRLIHRAHHEYSHSSWLQHWWNTAGYLAVRDPIVVNVSYFFQFADDPSAITQTSRGAALLHAMVHYRQQVCSGQLPAQTIGTKERTTVLCSTAYKYMFHACRIPLPDQDVVELHDPSLYHHVAVCRHGQFFAMNVCCPNTGKPYPLQVLQQGLQDCIDMADRQQQQGNNIPTIGICTSGNRDTWAHTRATMIQQIPGMSEALKVLESSAILLCLDDEAPISRAECATMCWTGGVTQGPNRWYDKSVQIICATNGKAGLVGEHSMMDGMPMVGLADMMTKMTYDKCLANETVDATNCHVRPIFRDVLLPVAASVQPMVDQAQQEFNNLINSHDLHVQSFQGYGSDFIKQSGFSPDAFVQMAIQVATYRLWGGEQVGTYESTQVRPFLHGRTETTRSVSTESAAWVQQMGLRPLHDEHKDEVRKKKLQLLKNAVDAHVKYTGWAAKAQGVDRHFFGLSMLVKDGEKAPDLYSDPVFIRSKRWRVSTSHLTHPKFDGWGYGEVVPDGVGLAYSIHRRHCVFNITALKEHGWTDKLSQLLEEALLEMRTMIEMDKPITSKL